jgi:HK97 family phage major capsid protein
VSELDQRIEALTGAVTDLAAKSAEAKSGEKDRYESIKGELATQAAEFETLLEEKRKEELTSTVTDLKARMDEFRPASKAAAILRGADGDDEDDQISANHGTTGFGSMLAAIAAFKSSPSPANWAALAATGATESTKATVGDTNANGGYLIPLNFVSQVVEICQGRNIWRQLMNVNNGVRGLGVNIPYELNDDSLQRAIGQGGEAIAYGSNKDIRDFTVGSATASLFPLARIITVGNQLLRYSEGTAERLVRNKLATAFAKAEDYYILSGTGANSQPKGILTSITAASATYTTALSSETRAAAIGRGIGALEARSCDADAVVMTPTDWWELAVETLGTSGSGGWALAPALGAASQPVLRNFPLWGVPVYRDALGFLTAGTALIGNWSDVDLFFGDEYRVDVSSEAGTNFALNLTSFRAEEEMAFNADPYVLTGKIQRVTGL